MPTGVVKKVFKDKGFGFITPDDGTADIFAPVRTLVGSEANLREGLKVIFESEIEARTNKPKATTWSVIEGSAADAQVAAATSAAAAAYSGMAGYNLLAAGYGAMAGGMLGADRISPYGQIPGVAYGAMPGALGIAGAMPTAGFDPNLAAAAAMALPAGWESVTDPASGKIYYANRATGESSWTPPMAALANPAAMVNTTVMTNPAAAVMTNPAAAALTNPAAALTNPVGVVMTNGAAATMTNPTAVAGVAPAATAMAPVEAAAASIAPAAAGGPVAVAAVVPEATTTPVVAAAPVVSAQPASLPAGWESATDPASGRTYYFNRSTNETTWVIPAQA